MRGLLKRILNKFGYELTRVIRHPDADSPYSRVPPSGDHAIVDLEALAAMSRSIPGMISPRRGQLLYALCYMQRLEGDVVEIGSWQGRSTSFLARAVRESGNGRLFAIDHFKGNVGKEDRYIVGRQDLSDLKTGFQSNLERLGLADEVELLDMPNTEAAQELGDAEIRFLFIDGDHTREGVETDISLFFPKLRDGAVVVFDDFSPEFPGLLEAVDRLLAQRSFSRMMSYENTLVLMS